MLIKEENHNIYVLWSKQPQNHYIENKLYGTMTLLTCKVDEPYYGIDLEVFGVVRGQEANYFAIKKIWNPGIELVLIYKRFLGILSNILVLFR